MESSSSSTRTYKLVLTEQEANWLKALVQNPIDVASPKNEPLFDKQMRIKFYEALNVDTTSFVKLNDLMQPQPIIN